MLQKTYNPRLAESVWWNLLLLTVGGAISALCLQCVAPQHEFVAGGVMGVALLVDRWTSGIFPASAWYLIITVPITVWGYFFVSRRFLLYTAYGSLVTSCMGIFFDHIGYTVALDNELYAAVLGGVLLGAGGGIMLRSLGSGGGLDIISVVLKQRWNIAIGQFSFFFNAVLFVVACLCGTPFEKIIASIIMMFISSSVLEYVLGLFNHRKLVLVISDRGEEIGEAILVTERFGATMLRGKGAYSGRDREILLTVTNNVALKRLENLVYSIDPHALFIVENTFYVSGGQFARRAS